MTALFTEAHLIAVVPGLTADRLLAFVSADLVVPTAYPQGARYTRSDVARVHFLCELGDDLGLEEPALAVVMALVDHLHAARHDLVNLARAIEAEPPAIRRRIGRLWQQGPPVTQDERG